MLIIFHFLKYLMMLIIDRSKTISSHLLELNKRPNPILGEIDEIRLNNLDVQR